MIDSRLGWGGCNAGRAGVVYNSPKHRGALDCLPFQGLRDDLEYKFLGCIQDHHQLRIAICGESATHFVRGLEGATQRFITNRYFLRTRARTHMPMRIGPRTHIGSSDTDYGGGGWGGHPCSLCPLHDVVKRLEMRHYS